MTRAAKAERFADLRLKESPAVFCSPQDAGCTKSFVDAKAITTSNWSDLASLRIVIAAADHGSFRRAAVSLESKQSTLSRRIRLLEERLGVALFERSSGGVHVTAAGDRVVRTARRLLEQMDRMASIARSAGRGEAGDITIGICMPLLTNQMRVLFDEYLQRFPDIEIHVVEHARSRLLAGLAMGDIDVAIVGGEARAHQGPSMLLWSERIVAALPNGHRLTNNNTLYWTDLKKETFLLSQRDPGPDLQNILVQKLLSPGEPINIAYWNVGHESILAMLDVRQKISVQCESWVGFPCPGVIYREIRDAIGPTYLTFAACWERENNNPALARFIEVLRKHHPPTV